MSGVVGANLEFEIEYKNSQIFFSFLYDVKDCLVDFQIEGSDSQISSLNELFSSLLRKNRFEINQHYLTSTNIDNVLLLNVISKILFEFSPVFSELSKDSPTNIYNLICRCFGVSEQEIRSVIDRGATDLATITNLTKACGGCASCAGDIKLILKEKTNSTLIPILTPEEESALNVTQTTLAKIKREKIMGLWPVEFLKNHIIPMSKEYQFEVVSFVENTLYVKSENAVAELEDFIKQNNLSLVTFYI